MSVNSYRSGWVHEKILQQAIMGWNEKQHTLEHVQGHRIHMHTHTHTMHALYIFNSSKIPNCNFVRPTGNGSFAQATPENCFRI